MEEREAPARRISGFVARVAAIPTSDQNYTNVLWGTCMAEKRELKRYGYALGSLRRTLTDYRHALRDRFGDDHLALRYIRLSKADVAEMREDYANTVEEQNLNMRPVRLDELVATATKIVREAEGRHPAAIAAALALLTGRRVVELLKTGRFSEGTKRRTLIFSGQAKTGGSKNARTDPYEIPVHAEPKLLLAAFRILRREFDCTELTNGGVNDRYSKRLSIHANALFADANRTPLTMHELRAVYAIAAYAWLAPVTISPIAYLPRILGHGHGDYTTSHSYWKFHPIGEKRAVVADFRWGIADELVELDDALEDARDETVRERLAAQIERTQALYAELGGR
jgi:telomere resolvase